MAKKEVDPKKNPPAIQGGGEKDEKGNYHSKHTNLEVGTSENDSYKGKHRDEKR